MNFLGYFVNVDYICKPKIIYAYIYLQSYR